MSLFTEILLASALTFSPLAGYLSIPQPAFMIIAIILVVVSRKYKII